MAWQKKGPSNSLSEKRGVFGAVEVAGDGVNTSSTIQVEPGPQVPLEATQNSFAQERANQLGGKL
eukprot:2300294-Pyramimonas_sp.AAC.1